MPNRQISLRLAEEDITALRAVCRNRRVKRSALVSAFVRWLAEQDDASRPAPLFRELIDQAQAIEYDSDGD